MLTREEAKDYLRVDFDDDDGLIDNLLLAADEYLTGAVGTNYDKNSERAKMLQRIVIQDLYDSRGMSEIASSRTRQLVSDFALQLRLEMGGAM